MVLSLSNFEVLCTFFLFFGGSVDFLRDAITKLYNNLSFEALNKRKTLTLKKFLISLQTQVFA